MVSLCMIVKDEEENLRRCLLAVQGAVDEIIVVDTGSSDKTKEVALAFGAEVYDYEWTDDFAAARNFSLSKASGDWILWLDADEVLCQEEPDALRRCLAETSSDLMKIEMVHYYGESPAEESRSYRSAAHRLFRSGRGICFKGRIHEVPDGSGGRFSISAARGLLIRHDGYMDNAVLEKEKSKRNLTLLMKRRQEQPEPWVSYHIASEQYRLKEYEAAFAEVERAIRGFLDAGQLPPPLAYKLKYDILLSTGSWENTLQGLELALKLYPRYVDLEFYRGLVRAHQKQYEQACASFRRCLELGDHPTDELTLTGTGSHFALYHLGRCYQEQGNREQACQAYRQALTCYPGLKEAKQRLEECSAELNE